MCVCVVAELCDPVEEGAAGAVDVMEMEEGNALGEATGALEEEEGTVGLEATEEDGAAEDDGGRVTEGADVTDELGVVSVYVTFLTSCNLWSLK